MNSFERVIATVRQEKTDRIPVIPEVAAITARLIDKSVRDYVTNGEILAQSQMAGLSHYAYDSVMAFADLCIEAEAIGCPVEFPEDSYPYVTSPIIHSIDELTQLDIPDPAKSGRMPEVVRAVTIMKEHYKGTVPVIAHALAPLTIASRIVEIEKLLYMIVDEPENFRKLLDYTKSVSMKFVTALIDAGADGIIMFNPSASPAIMPAAIFREFELPNLADIFKQIKGYDSNVLTWYSVAGAIQEVISDLENINMDILTIDYLVPLDIAYSLSSTICFNGNIKPLSFVTDSSELVYSASKELLKISLNTGRFILGSGCEVPPNGRLENVKTLVTASHDMSREYKYYGKQKKGSKCVSFYPSQKKVYTESGANLLHVATEADLHIPQFCNRSGACGSCLVQIRGYNRALTTIEEIALSTQQVDNGFRYACLINVSSDLEVFISPATQETHESKIYTDDADSPCIDRKLGQFGLSPAILEIELPMTDEVRINNLSDHARLRRHVKGKIKPELLKKIPEIIRDNEKIWHAVLDDKNHEIIDIVHSSGILGAAVDIGTTNIIIYIHDLKKGDLVAFGSIRNPQHYYGANIMSRAEEVICKGPNHMKLRHGIVDGINKFLLDLSSESGCELNRIYKVVVVGNPVMHHMFLDLELKHLVRSPFVPVMSSPYSFSNADLGKQTKLTVNDQAVIVCPSILSGFVGSDISMGLLATGLFHCDELTLLIDFGTNGEIVLGKGKEFLTTSVAAGPAFEDAHLSCGKTAASGVIFKASIDDQLKNHYQTLDGKKPSGICGSAIIDITASLVRHGLIDERGCFIANSNNKNVRDGAYLLVPKQDTAYFKPIVISLKDIEEVQKSKAGIRAGVTVLMNEYGISADQIDKVLLTGAFGMTLNIENAISIGMIPDVEINKIEFVTNAAGTGARLYLLSQLAVAEVDQMSRYIKHIDLTSRKDFNDIFIDGMFFKT